LDKWVETRVVAKQ